MAELRKYGEATTILFPLIDAGTVDFEITPATDSGTDCEIIKDEGASTTCTNDFAHEGRGIYSLALTATEMQAARIVVTIVDDATKAFEDQAVIIETYGNASAQHAFDLDTATQSVSLAAGAITDASLAGNMEIVFETDFATNYNATRNAWATNVQDFVGTSAADPFNGQVVAASVTGNVGGNVTGSVGSNLELGPAEVNAEVDTALADIGLDHLISSALPTNWATDVAAGSVFDNIADDGTASYDRTTDSLQAVRDHVGDGTNLTEAGGTGDHLTAINLPDQTMNITGDITGNLSGSVGSVTGAVGSVTGNVGGNVTGSVGSNLELGPSEVNAEVVDALNTDTYAEPGQGAPGATISLAAKINYLYKGWRNKSTQTSSTWSLYDDAGSTVDQKAAVSDDGTTAEKGEVGTGP